MTDRQDKYKDLEVGQIAWYWHKTTTLSGNSYWSPIKVCKSRLMQDGCVNLFAYGISQGTVTVSEDFPNGPRCLNPDDVLTLAEGLKSLDKALDGINR